MDGSCDHLYFILIVVDLNGTADVVERCLGQGPGKIFRKAAVGSNAHANNAVVRLRDANLGLAGCQFHSVLQPLLEGCDAFDLADVLPALSNGRSTSHDATQQDHSSASNQRCHSVSPDLRKGKKDLDAIELYPNEPGPDTFVKPQANVRRKRRPSPLQSAAARHPSHGSEPNSHVHRNRANTVDAVHRG